VSIPDVRLRDLIRQSLGKSTGEITRAEMIALTLLTGDGRGIFDLTGLEFADNLTDLRLRHNSTSDLSPISNLVNLEKLNLYVNRVTDLSPLSGLINLDFLITND